MSCNALGNIFSLVLGKQAADWGVVFRKTNGGGCCLKEAEIPV